MHKTIKEKHFVLLTIILLLFTQIVPAAMVMAEGESIDSNTEIYDIGATKVENAHQLNLKQKTSHTITNLTIQLPKGTQLDEDSLNKQFSKDSIVNYDDEKQLIKIESPKGLNKEFKLSISSEETNVLIYLETFENENKITEELHDVKLMKVEKSAESEEEVKEKRAEPISPRVGDVNLDIDISPYKKEVESGKAAMYNLVFKATGSQKEYTDAQIVVDLPINDYTEFTQDLNELKIAGVKPVFNKENKTLVYDFETLKTGQTYDVMIKVDTKNGYTPNKTELIASASFEAKERSKVQDEAKVTVKASSAISVNKTFTGTVWEDGEWKNNVPVKPDRITVWEIKVEIPKKDIGQMYLQEGSKIVVTDTLPKGLLFESAVTPGVKQDGNKLVWEFDAPSLEEQESFEGDLFTKTIEVWLRTGERTEDTVQKNLASVDATLINNDVIKDASEAKIPIFSENITNPASGSFQIPAHYGPSNGEGKTASDMNDLNPNPHVYDDALLRFGLDITALYEGTHADFEELSYKYHIDSNLILNGIDTPGNFIYYPYYQYYNPDESGHISMPFEEFEREPEYDIYAVVDGRRTLLIKNAEHGKYYSKK